jgi:hypothetical protein
MAEFCCAKSDEYLRQAQAYNNAAHFIAIRNRTAVPPLQFGHPRLSFFKKSLLEDMIIVLASQNNYFSISLFPASLASFNAVGC